MTEIIKNIALIYVMQKRNDLAIGAIKDARAANPLDVGLILTEANLYIQLGDKQKFADLMKEAIERDPNNHILYFNLGVITSEQGDRNKARFYYEKAIELDPSYASSYLNLAALILDGEPELVEKMNSLGNSRADNIKYEQLQKQREESIELYSKGNRIDLVKSEEDEINIIKEFLPKQMDDDEIINLVKEAIKSQDAKSIKDMGKVMNYLKENYATNMDFSKASKFLKDMLI